LGTLPAVPGGTPAQDLPAIFKIRLVIGFWKALYFDRSPIKPDPAHVRSPMRLSRSRFGRLASSSSKVGMAAI
jgi:hypothetical protein